MITMNSDGKEQKSSVSYYKPAISQLICSLSEMYVTVDSLNSIN